MTRAAYHLSKRAEEELIQPLLRLLDEHGIIPSSAVQNVRISSPTTAVPWDIRIDHSRGTLLVDIKLAPKAHVWGAVAPQTFRDVRTSLENGVSVLLFIPPKIYLLSPQLLPHLPEELSIGFLETYTPSTFVDEETARRVWEVYDRMVLS